MGLAFRLCPGQGLYDLLAGAFLTGARYGELIEVRVGHFDARAETLRVNVSKIGARTIVLQSSASKFFMELVKGRAADQHIFVREDGSLWTRSDQTRPIKDALEKAGLSDSGSIYALTYLHFSSN